MKIGDVVLKVTMARFSRTLATLVGSGVDIVKALEITGNTSGNWVIEQALAEVRVKVHEGVPIAQPLIENPVFPPMVSQMIKIGEETGELEKMLGKIADFYEDEVETSINALTSIIEPITMIAVGVHGGDHRDRDVPADVQDAEARQQQRLARQLIRGQDLPASSRGVATDPDLARCARGSRRQLWTVRHGACPRTWPGGTFLWREAVPAAWLLAFGSL